MRWIRAENELHEAAIQETGLDDFGSEPYREGLHALFKALDTDLQLTASGWQTFSKIILGQLKARLYARKGWIDHPEVLSIPIHRPLIITGMPRTGTTALHRLLSVDPQFQHIEAWLLQAPMIRPPRETWEAHREYLDCAANFEAFYACTPEFRAVHDFAPGEPEECTGLLALNFASSAFVAHWDLPTYAQWLTSQSLHLSYNYYKNVLRLIGARSPQRCWLLKSPHHMTEINSVLEVFPDACIIQTHRDPVKAIPSFCSFLNGAKSIGDETMPPTALGSRQCAHWRRALDQIKAARRATAQQIFDVDHRRFVSNPLEVVYDIYDYFGLTLSSFAEQQMRTWISASPTSRHGKHEYAIDSWGISPGEIRDIFADYCLQHDF